MQNRNKMSGVGTLFFHLHIHSPRVRLRQMSWTETQKKKLKDPRFKKKKHSLQKPVEKISQSSPLKSLRRPRDGCAGPWQKPTLWRGTLLPPPRGACDDPRRQRSVPLARSRRWKSWRTTCWTAKMNKKERVHQLFVVFEKTLSLYF